MVPRTSDTPVKAYVQRLILYFGAVATESAWLDGVNSSVTIRSGSVPWAAKMAFIPLLKFFGPQIKCVNRLYCPEVNWFRWSSLIRPTTARLPVSLSRSEEHTSELQ